MKELILIYLLPLGGLFLLILGGLWFWGNKTTKRLRITHGSLSDEPSRETLKEYLLKYATSSNGIYHLYGTMKHLVFSVSGSAAPHASAVFGYTEKFRTNLMLTDPLCRPDLRADAISRFIKYSRSRKRDALLLAVDEATAQEASKQGYKLLKIGHEPIFDLTVYDPESLPSKLKSSIRQVGKKGVVIEEISLAEIFTPTIANSLNELLSKWFLTRGSDAFRLLTEVAPVKAAEDKKFFVARSTESIEGLLVCSKIFGRNGYFLHDLIRAPFSINGVTDALVFHALKSLKEQGFAMASLGVSPLAGINPATDKSQFPKVTRILKWAFENVRYTYRFKELYHFKKKFLPSTEEPVFLAVPSSGLRPRHVLAILSVFSNLNPLKQVSFVLRKWRSGYNLPRPLAWALNPDKVFLPPIASFDSENIFRRLKFTLTMLFLNIYTFIYTTDLSGRIDRDILTQHGFSYNNFADHSWFILVTSNFVHFNYTHLIANMTGLVLFCGALEIIGGSFLTGLVFFFGLQANLPTGLVLLPLLRVISPELFSETIAYTDVGASLGVMCGLGGIAYLLKPKIRICLVSFTCLLFCGYAFIANELIGIDHAIAVLCGVALTKAYFEYQPSQDMFDTVEVRYFDRRAKRQDRRAPEASRYGGNRVA